MIDKLRMLEKELIDYATRYAVNVAFVHNSKPGRATIKLSDSATKERIYEVDVSGISDIGGTVGKMISDVGKYRGDISSMYPSTFVEYCRADVEDTRRLYEMAKQALFRYNGISLPAIEDVIFNAPATIVFWSDHTKTVVKTQNGETYDPEKGMAMAIAKKALGNDYGYYETFARHIGRYEKRKKKEAAK